MPGGNQSGPIGQGALTGQATGYCAGFNQPGWMNRMLGRGFGRGPGGGLGWGGSGGGGGWGHRRWFRATGMPGWQRAAMGLAVWGRGPLPAAADAAPPIAPEQELDWLKQQAGQLEAGLERIRRRMAELSKAEAK
jgi:hypothetical protein